MVLKSKVGTVLIKVLVYKLFRLEVAADTVPAPTIFITLNIIKHC